MIAELVDEFEEVFIVRGGLHLPELHTSISQGIENNKKVLRGRIPWEGGWRRCLRSRECLRDGNPTRKRDQACHSHSHRHAIVFLE